MNKKIKDFFNSGKIIKSGGNLPFSISNSSKVWLVVSGSIDIFFIPTKKGSVKSSREYLYTVEEGEIILGLGGENFKDFNFMFIGVGTYNSQVAEANFIDMIKLVHKSGLGDVVSGILGYGGVAVDIVTLIEKWIISVSENLSLTPPPSHYVTSRTIKEFSVLKGEKLRPVKGVHWVDSTGNFKFLGKEENVVKKGFFLIPVTKDSWLEFQEDSLITSFNTINLIYRNSLIEGINTYRDMIVKISLHNYQFRVKKDLERLKKSNSLDAEKIEKAMWKLASIIKPEKGKKEKILESSNYLLEACNLVGKELNIKFSDYDDPNSLVNPLTKICRISRVRSRDVILKEEWWKKDVGHFIAYLSDGKKPVAVIQRADTKYEVIDPSTGNSFFINEKTSELLEPQAHQFYRPLPSKKLKIKDLFLFAIYGRGKDIIFITILSLVGGILGMAVPLVTGTIFDTIIPSADKLNLFQIIFGLIAIGFSTSIFNLCRSFAILRLSIKTETSMQSAIWDRLLNLPVSFFTKFSIGDLALRANSVNTIYRMVSGATITTFLSGIFSIFNFGLLFYYSTSLAFVALILVLFFALVTLIHSYFQILIQRKNMEIQGKLSSLILQLIKGLVKIRVAGAEKRAFSVWSKKYYESRKLNIKSRKISNSLTVFNSFFSIIPQFFIFMFIAIYMGKDNSFSTGSFMAFSAAFGQFMASTLELSSVLITIMGIVPVYERGKPILETEPEINEGKLDPGNLYGNIEINHLNFSYSEDGPLILNDVSMEIKSGEFVAVVGPSGSGKSTLLRLLLRFEKPESGFIYFDGKNSADLDPTALRKKFGVVLQNGKLLAGDIFSNIIGANRMTLEDAWEAASMAGLAEDIKKMPMGMHTIVSEEAGNFSGGQKQRLLIARALVTKPRIIFFDEATSALDNNTQTIVTDSLDRIAATRVVIAHRLSTIINADKIFVMEKGKIVQTGTFEQLVKIPGLFQELVKRQIV